ncbi:hypothetical protein [Motilimonas sp. KMU-193]|uniref:hypothetical protein n=1 Tax=Motilimonas sp. KMU-193 TaxID=3388668 RepID=UPI00396B08D7
MMNLAQHENSHIQRLLIAGLTLISLLIEGWFADALMMLAVLLWLWLPELQKLSKANWIRYKENLFWLLH